MSNEHGLVSSAHSSKKPEPQSEVDDASVPSQDETAIQTAAAVERMRSFAQSRNRGCDIDIKAEIDEGRLSFAHHPQSIRLPVFFDTEFTELTPAVRPIEFLSTGVRTITWTPWR